MEPYIIIVLLGWDLIPIWHNFHISYIFNLFTFYTYWFSSMTTYCSRKMLLSGDVTNYYHYK